MKKDRVWKAVIFIIMGCFVLLTEQFSGAPGVVLKLGQYKYIVALIFFSMSIYLIVNRNYNDKSS